MDIGLSTGAWKTYQGLHSWWDTDSPSLSNHQLSITPPWDLVSPSPSMVGCGLTWSCTSFMQASIAAVCSWMCLCYPEQKTLFWRNLLQYVALRLFLALFHYIPLLLGIRSWAPYRCLFSVFDQLSISMLSSIQCIKMLLWKDQKIC